MDYDGAYKVLFSTARMVVDLVRGYARELDLDEIDYTTLEPASPSYLGAEAVKRYGDLLWKVQTKGGRPVYVLVLLEFQSSVQDYMAVRLMTYVGLLYESLCQRQGFPPLPILVPVVLYCGRDRWTAADSVRPLVLAEPAALAGFVPGFRYILIDERRCELLGLEQRNLVDAMIRCGRAASAPAASEEVLRLQEWLRGDANAALRRAFVTWLDIVLIRPQFPEVKLKAGDGLVEVAKVLGNSMTWIEQAETEGREEALRDTFQRVVRNRFGEPVAEAVASLSRPFESGETFARALDRAYVCRSEDELLSKLATL